MAINEMKFFIEEDDPSGRCLVLEEAWSPQFADVIKTERIRTLRFSFSNGWKDDNIDFLDQIPDCVAGFQVYSWKVSDLSPLTKRREIKHLSFQVELKRVFSLSSIGGLQTLKFACSAKTKNLEKCDNLEHLNIVGYPEMNIELLAPLQRLVRLQVMSKKLTSTMGMASLGNLRSIDFSGCPNLVGLDELDQLSSLENLELSGCKKIDALPQISSLKNLKSVIIEDCGAIRSLDFLAGSASLERVLIIGNTRVRDGDLTPLRSLPKLNDVRVAEGDYNLSHNEVLALRK